MSGGAWVPFRRTVQMFRAATANGGGFAVLGPVDVFPCKHRGQVQSVRAFLQTQDAAVDVALGFTAFLSQQAGDIAAVVNGVPGGSAVGDDLVVETAASGVVTRDSGAIAIDMQLGQDASQFENGLKAWVVTAIDAGTVIGDAALIRLVIAGMHWEECGCKHG